MLFQFLSSLSFPRRRESSRGSPKLPSFLPHYFRATTQGRPYAPIFPSNGLLAEAYNFIGILPALYASLPAIIAYFIASAILSGSLAPAIPVFIKTASHPSSI